ncbi:hypothetical protein GCM10007907_22920 [Chitinimonas prasina]|uniref:Uncharacterized protein n=1 Tax=Chitinimonas prasina TaxID=1434937 RepID=A0ABQ5YET1_9NEIS|nr:hypothetical protein [Chitinimonas prasina]GLR13502.1 hypothetical protein GCM10007907_22920 [Chitinimonas prasina]
MSITSASYGSDQAGLVSGCHFKAGEPGREIDSAAVHSWQHQGGERGELIWLYFNLTHTAFERWMQPQSVLSDEFFASYITAGFFDMSVGDVPLAHHPSGFWVMVVLVVTFTLLAGWWAFRKQASL